MKYQTTLLEDWIEQFYKWINIYHPHQLDFLDVACRLGMTLHFQRFSSRVYNGEIIIDEQLSSKEQWEDFGHELCHLYRQEGNQLAMNKEFLLLQEAKAENFAMHFCVPTFMLLNFEISNYYGEGSNFISETFNVTRKFAKKRLEHFSRQLDQVKADFELMNLKEPVFNYCKNIPAKPVPDHAKSIV